MKEKINPALLSTTNPQEPYVFSLSSSDCFNVSPIFLTFPILSLAHAWSNRPIVTYLLANPAASDRPMRKPAFYRFKLCAYISPSLW